MILGLLTRLDRTGLPLLGARILLGCMFILMGWSKAWDPVEFLKLIREYQLLPDSAYLLLNLTAVALPWLEIICGVALLVGVFIRGASLTLLVMLTVFTVAIVVRALAIHEARGTPFWSVHFDCGCGGGDVYMYRKLPENVLLWLFAWIGLLSQSRRFCLGNLFGRASQVPIIDTHGDGISATHSA